MWSKRMRRVAAIGTATNNVAANTGTASRTGTLTTPGLPLARDVSAPLAEIVRFMGRESDNYTAELLLKALGASTGVVGSTAAGAKVVLGMLLALGAFLAGAIAAGVLMERSVFIGLVIPGDLILALGGAVVRAAHVARAAEREDRCREPRRRDGPSLGRRRDPRGTADGAHGFATSGRIAAAAASGEP